MIEMSEEFLKKLADTLGMTVEQVYNIYTVGVKKTALLNIISTSVMILGVILISILSVGVIADANENDSGRWDDSKTRTSIDKFNGEDYFNGEMIVNLMAAFAKEQLESHPSEAKEERINKWIPISEKEPDSIKSVLCFGSSWNNTYIVQYVNRRFNFKEGTQGAADVITHWMPLPEPPKIKQG